MQTTGEKVSALRLRVIGLLLAATAISIVVTSVSVRPPNADAAIASGTSTAGSCLPVDEGLLEYAKRLATDPDSVMQETRIAYDIAMVPLTEVVEVTDDQLCSQAGREYKKLLGLKGKAPDVYMVRIGSRYIAANHSIESSTEFTSFLALNEQMEKVAAFAS